MQGLFLLLSGIWGYCVHDITFYFLLSIYLLLKYYFARGEKGKISPFSTLCYASSFYFYKNVENATEEIAAFYVYQYSKGY